MAEYLCEEGIDPKFLEEPDIELTKIEDLITRSHTVHGTLDG